MPFSFQYLLPHRIKSSHVIDLVIAQLCELGTLESRRFPRPKVPALLNAFRSAPCSRIILNKEWLQAQLIQA
jgi:hypothetical protein